MESIEVQEILELLLNTLQKLAHERGNPFQSSYGEIGAACRFQPSVVRSGLMAFRAHRVLRVSPITHPTRADIERRFYLDIKQDEVGRLGESVALDRPSFPQWFGEGPEKRPIANAMGDQRWEEERRKDAAKNEREEEENFIAWSAIALNRAAGCCQACGALDVDLEVFFRTYVMQGMYDCSGPQDFIALCRICANVLHECGREPEE